VPREQRELLLDEFERSGLAGAEFARVVGVKYQTFANWRQQRARKRQGHASSQSLEPKAQSLQWAEGILANSAVQKTPSAALMVRLRGGAQLEVNSRSQAELAAALMRALEKLAC
jgi:hypothetical protein